MKRDMDLIRDLLLKLEALDVNAFEVATVSTENLDLDGYEAAQIDHHMALLYEAGLIVSGIDQDALGEGTWVFRRVTWAGHDFLDTIRDPEVWKRTKEGASKLGGWTFGLIKDLGTAYLKHKARERLGLDL